MVKESVRLSVNTPVLILKAERCSTFIQTLPFLLSGFQIKGATINIKNKNVIPNVSRNDVNKDTNHYFSYAIGKALHLWLLDNLQLSVDRKYLVAIFIEECYAAENIFLK
jgi:hypothetical protein